MKKRISALICLTLCALITLSACGQGGTPPDPSVGESSTTVGTESTGQNKAPAQSGPNWISDEKVTLKVWAMKEDTIEDLQTNAYIEWLQQECNVELQFEQASTAEALQKFNLSLASGNYPDIYLGCNQLTNMNSTIMNSTLMKYGSAGIFVPLNDLIEQHGPNTQKLISDVDYVKSAITMPDGNIYGLPTYSEIYHCRYSDKLWIDQSWLDNLKLKMPTTTDELYDVLKAFKEQDANGNGDTGDEIPLAGSIEGWHSDPSSFLMNAFIYDDDNKRLAIENEKVVSIVNQDAYREGLRFANKLYSEGLFYSESYAQTTEQLKSLTANTPNIVGSFAIGAPMGVIDGSAELYQNCVTVPPLAGPEGVRYASYYGYDDLRLGAFMITSACKNPEAAFKLADFMYSEDASVRLRQGVKDSDWREATDGETTFDDKPAQYARITPLITDGAAQNNHMGNTGIFRETNDSFIGAWAVDNDFDIRSMNGIEQLLIEQTWPYDGCEPEKTVPPMIFTDEENSEVSIIETEVQKFVKEQRALFITGQRSLDSDWDNYVNDLNKLGLERMIEIYNTAYARMNTGA